MVTFSELSLIAIKSFDEYRCFTYKGLNTIFVSLPVLPSLPLLSNLSIKSLTIFFILSLSTLLFTLGVSLYHLVPFHLVYFYGLLLCYLVGKLLAYMCVRNSLNETCVTFFHTFCHILAGAMEFCQLAILPTVQKPNLTNSLSVT
jgi:hypothetical protein